MSVVLKKLFWFTCWRWAVVCLFGSYFSPSLCEYRPVLEWDVCSPSRIQVTLTGAVDGGIIYIKGYGAACKQTTYQIETEHEFEFSACGIDTSETYFTIIVQKNPLYQTGTDLQESLLCIYDLSDITVNNGLNVGDDDDDAGINKTVKPSAQMKLYRNGLDIGGNSVKLTDLVTMTIQIDNEFIQDFDIKAKSCTANYLDIITSYCATDIELFPDFNHVTRGVITATFGAFRTTDLSSGLVEMTFSCTLKVCQDACAPAACDSGVEGWGRKKRDVEEDNVYDLNVGASLSVGTRVKVEPTGRRTNDELCLNTIAFVVGLLLIISVLVVSMAMTSYVTTRLVRKSEQLRQLRGDNENMRNTSSPAKRRLSSVSVITTNNITRTLTTKTNDKTSPQVDKAFPTNKKVLQKQASVSVVYNQHVLNKSSYGEHSTVRNQSVNATISTSVPSKIATNPQRENIRLASNSCTSKMADVSHERKSNMDIGALKATKNKLVQYQNALEQFGLAHKSQRSQQL